LRRAKGAPYGELASARLTLAAALAARDGNGGLRTSSAAGMMKTQERAPKVSIAKRQP